MAAHSICTVCRCVWAVIVAALVAGIKYVRVHRLRAYQSLNSILQHIHNTDAVVSDWKYNQFYRQYQINCVILYARLHWSVFIHTKMCRGATICTQIVFQTVFYLIFNLEFRSMAWFPAQTQ